MPIQGEIKTLYKNKNNTSPIFPTTKVKAVSDENGIGLDALLRDNYATKTYVTSEIAKAQVGGDDSEIDLSGFATKDDVANIKHPISSVNNKTGAVVLTAEDIGARPDNWMPTATDVGAHPNTWLPTPAQIGAPNSITRPVYDTWFSFRIVGNGVNNGQSKERQPVTLIISGQNGQIINAQFIASTIDGHPLGDCFVSSAMNMGIDVIVYETVGNETHYSISLTGITHAYASAQITIPSIDSMTLGSYNGSYGTTSVLSTKTLSYDFVGAAPAGYVAAQYHPQSNTELEMILTNIINSMNERTVRFVTINDAQGVIWDGGTCLALVSRGGGAYALVRLFHYSRNGASLVKSYVNGTWYPVEWENPPMELGVEYRTTERYNGEAVYVIRVNCGPVSATGVTRTPIGATVKTHVDYEVKFIKTATPGIVHKTVLYSSGGGISAYVFMEHDNIGIFNTTSENSSYEAQVTVKYTKG